LVTVYKDDALTEKLRGFPCSGGKRRGGHEQALIRFVLVEASKKVPNRPGTDIPLRGGSGRRFPEILQVCFDASLMEDGLDILAATEHVVNQDRGLNFN